jgi:hypothetical protein
VKLRSGVAAARLRGKAFGSGTQLLDHWHNSPVAWRARGWERGTGKTPPWLEPSVFRLRWGGDFGRIELAYGFDRITEPLPPSVGALVFLGLLFSGVSLQENDRIPCRKNRQRTSASVCKDPTMRAVSHGARSSQELRNTSSPKPLKGLRLPSISVS